MVFLLYFIFTILEVYLLILVGDKIGFWPILAYIVGTAWIGLRLVKSKGFLWMANLQNQGVHRLEKEMTKGIAIWLAGILLIIPGFITDFMAILCLIPSVQRRISKALVKNIQSRVNHGQVRVFTSFKNIHQNSYSPPFSSSMKDVTPKPPEELGNGN